MYTIKDILKVEVAPALGCTEPAAVALSTAAAGSLLVGKELESIELWLDPNIYKNAMGVAIPGAQGAWGIGLAAALGFLCGDPSRRMEVLEQVDREWLVEAQKLVEADIVKVELVGDREGIYIRSLLKTGSETAEAVIEKVHDNLTTLEYNGEQVADHPLLCDISRERSDISDLEAFLRGQTLEELLLMVGTMDKEDFDFIMQGVEYNLKLARHGLALGSGLGVGKTLDRLVREGLLKKDMMLSARILASSACDARMSGAKMPAMSSAGSGNHGLTAILPIWAVREYVHGVDEKVVLEGIALSHIVTGYIKAHTGRLSAVCGCSIAAGAGATAGIAYLLGGNLSHIAGAIKNLIEDLAGVICDGAKSGCALKLSTAAGTAVQSALFALHGIDVKESDGIIAATPEQTMRNVGQLSTQGMIETDRTILQIMLEKQFGGKEAEVDAEDFARTF
jgi:L-cysteine desulfidase